MRRLLDCETYIDLKPPKLKDGQNKLLLNNGIIFPSNIGYALLPLDIAAKKGQYPLLSEGLARYEDLNGDIKLFNLSNNSTGQSDIPRAIPFVLLKNNNSTNSFKNVTPDKSNGYAISARSSSKINIYMNMYSIGIWSVDGTSYEGLTPFRDLNAMFASAIIQYKMIAENQADRFFNNSVIIELLTRIYSYLFSKAIQGSKLSVFGANEFDEDSARFIIGKFFLKYCIEKDNDDIINDIAYKAIVHNSSKIALIDNEQNLNIDYSSLKGFLSTFGNVFFASPVEETSFKKQWVNIVGEMGIYSMEYVPFFIHMLICAKYNAFAGTNNRLATKLNKVNLENLGLEKLFKELCYEVRK